MQKNKKSLKIILVLTLAMLCVFSGIVAGCSEPKPEVKKPVVSDLSVDVGDSTLPIDNGDWQITSVELDGKALELSTDYLVVDGWLVWGIDVYGEWGVGEHTVKLVAGEENLSFKLTITDNKAPDYAFDMGFEEKSVVVGEDLVLPVVDRANEYQVYNVSYSLVKAGVTDAVYSETDVEKTADNIVIKDLTSGDYTYTVKIVKGETEINSYSAVIKFRTEDEITIAKDIFGKELFESWAISLDENVGACIVIAYDDEAEAFKLTMSNSNEGLGGRHYVAYMPIDNFRLALSLGKEYLAFTMKASQDYISYPSSGVRFFGKAYPGIDGSAIANGNEGIYLMGDDVVTDMLDTDYVSYYIDIKSVLQSHENVKYFAINFNGANGSSLWFKNSEFLTAQEYEERTINGAPSCKFDFGFIENNTFIEGQTIDFAVATRLLPKQEYDIVYSIIKGETTVKTATNVEKTESKFSVADLVIGDYIYKVEIKKDDSVVKTYERAFKVESVTKANIFGKDTTWQVTSNHILSAYDEEEAALKITMANVGEDINSRYFVAYTSVSSLRAAIEKGCNYLSFKVKASAKYLTMPVSTYKAGVRIFGKVADGLDGVQIIDGQEGIYGIKDLYAADLTADAYVDVIIDIATVLNAHSNINYLGLCVNGANGGSIWFKDSKFLTTDEFEEIMINGAPLYDFDFGFSENNAFIEGQAIDFAVATRLFSKQEFDIVYSIIKGETTVKTASNVEKTESKFSVADLVIGDYIYKVEIKKGDSVVNTLERAFKVEKDPGVNIFGKDITWEAANSSVLGVGYSDGQEAVYANAGSTVGAINARDCVIYTSIEPLRNAVKNGYTHMTFKVMASEGFLEAVAGCVFGVRIFGKVNSGKDSNVIATNSDAGIYEIEDITADDLTEGSYVTVTIDIATVLNAHSDINYLGLCVSGRAGNNIFFKDASFVKTNA